MAVTKVNKSEMKQLIREVFMEMVAEGKIPATTQVPGTQQPQGSVLERILTDTAMTSLPVAMQAEAAMGMQQGYGGYQQMPGYGYPQQGYGPPQQMHGQGLLPPQHHQQTADPTKRWASIAFNSPIKNRPGSESSGFGNPDGFLPGQSMSGLR
jgi:hypothetical protein